MSAALDAALAARDPALPGLATLLDAGAFARALTAALPDAGVTSAVPVYVRYKPETSCLVGYRVRTAGGEHDVYARAHRVDAPEKLRSADRAARRGSALGPGGVVLGALAVAVHVAPHDRRLTVLPAVADPDRRAELLRAAVPDHPPLHTAALRPLRHKPERRWVGVLEGSGGARALLKVHADPPAAGPRLGALPAHGLVVQPWVPGRSLDTLLGAGHPELERDAAAAGAALARLHRGPRADDLAARRGADGRAARLRAAADAVARLVPSLAARAGALARALADPPAGPVGPVHGDCSVDQAVVGDDGRVTLIDLDAARIDDQGADLGSFLADLEARTLGRTVRDRTALVAATAFLRGYRAAGGPAPTSGEALDRHVAAGLLLRSAEPFRARHPRWGAQTWAHVRRAEERSGALGHRWSLTHR